jgi:hypothetical protein
MSSESSHGLGHLRSPYTGSETIRAFGGNRQFERAVNVPIKALAMRMRTYRSPTTTRNTWQSGIPFHLIFYGTSLESELCVKRL